MKNFLGFILLINSFVHGQQHLSPDLITFPVSPEAARMVTYGNTPVNLFYGQLDKSIGLFNGTLDDFPLPITLNYSYAGYRVEETPSVIGLGWQLSIGGVVTREVRGYPDEHPKGYYASGQEGVGPYLNTGNMTYKQAESLLNGQFDSEADLYNISVNGINFSFKIGTDGSPAYLSRHDYKIAFTRSTQNIHDITSFTLTDTKGIKYTFSAREYTQRVEGHDAVFEDNFPRYGTSWQLTTILLYGRRQINFNYTDDEIFNYSYYASGDDGILVNQMQEGLVSPTYSEGSAKDLINRKLLSSITCENFNVGFTRTLVNNQDVYSQIIVRDGKGNTISKYDFTYEGLRNNLKKIKHNNKFFYEFGYISGYELAFMNAVNIMPWKQDFWGFYNGKNNTYAFTRPTVSNGPGLNSDRSPNYSYTATGALNSIKHPTGGTTTIQYEPNTIATTLVASQLQPNVRLGMSFKTDNRNDLPFEKELTYRITLTRNTLARLSHKVVTDNHSDIEILLKRVDENCGITTNYYVAIPNARTAQGNSTPGVCPWFYFNFNDGVCDSCIFENNSQGTFFMQAGTYEIKFHTYKNFGNVTANVILDYYREDLENDINLMNTQVGGIRVKSVTDTPIFGEPVVTYYDYNGNDGISTGQPYAKLVTEVKYRLGWMPLGGGGLTINPPRYVTEYSSSPYNMLLKRGIPVYYRSVVKYAKKVETIVRGRFICDICEGASAGRPTISYIGTGLGPNTKYVDYPFGYTRAIFESPSRSSNPYPFVPAGNDNSVGQISTESVFNETDPTHFTPLLQSQDNIYNYYGSSNQTFVDENPFYPKSLRIGYKIRLTIQAQNTASNLTVNDCYHLKIYKESDSDALLRQTTTREYFGESYTEKVSSNEYDSHRQLKKQTVINNLNQGLANYERLTTELYYPYDFNDAVSQEMVSKNVMTPLVKVETKRDGEVLETTQYKYLDVNGSGLFKPSSFSKGKGGNQPEERMNYSYDDKGNISVISKEDVRPNLQGYLSKGKTMIIWGYNKSLPIAKIENIDSGVGTITELQRLSDLDVDNSSTCSGSSCTELQLRAALDNLRTLYPNALITTYTHDPLIGITSMTDPRGRRTTYEYDDQGRLVRARDHQGNILSENSYHFVTEN